MKKIIIISLLLSFTSLLKAEVLIIDRVKQAQSSDIPSKGMSMNQIISQFGEPHSKSIAVGNPPITKWSYNKYTVYFEKQWVISSVINKSSSNEKGPKPINN